jgi:hypothetical protein
MPAVVMTCAGADLHLLRLRSTTCVALAHTARAQNVGPDFEGLEIIVLKKPRDVVGIVTSSFEGKSNIFQFFQHSAQQLLLEFLTIRAWSAAAFARVSFARTSLITDRRSQVAVCNLLRAPILAVGLGEWLLLPWAHTRRHSRGVAPTEQVYDASEPSAPDSGIPNCGQHALIQERMD